ncbi:hypothetical protein IPJ70_02330 [Candidatus Campbellbacteria bacterium]|nr:MAG: hypothetical protein IPJ70_02330 [Candidatus Campbellbacteria bacterium]
MKSLNTALVARVNKKTAQPLLWIVLALLVGWPLACAIAAHGQEVNGDQLAMTTNLVTGVNIAPVTVLEKDDLWTLETSWSSRSAFKSFGSVASDDPIAGLSLTYADDNWDVFLLGVKALGTHDAGVMAHFIDPIIQRKFSLGKWSGKAGVEIFYAPPYRGGKSSTFIGPLGSFSRTLRGGWSTELGWQYVGVYHTAYGDGDRLYAYGEMSYVYEKGPWVLGMSGGVIASDKERYSIYAKPSVSYQGRLMKLKLSLLRSESDSRSGRFAIPATPTVSTIWTF